MFIRHHFLNLFAYLLVLSIFLLNFFDKTYLKTVIYSLALAILSDFTWIIVEANVFHSTFRTTGGNSTSPITLRCKLAFSSLCI